MSDATEPYVTVPIPYSSHLDNLFGVICLFCFLIGTIGQFN